MGHICRRGLLLIILSWWCLRKGPVQSMDKRIGLLIKYRKKSSRSCETGEVNAKGFGAIMPRIIWPSIKYEFPGRAKRESLEIQRKAKGLVGGLKMVQKNESHKEWLLYEIRDPTDRALGKINLNQNAFNSICQFDSDFYHWFQLSRPRQGIWTCRNSFLRLKSSIEGVLNGLKTIWSQYKINIPLSILP